MGNTNSVSEHYYIKTPDIKHDFKLADQNNIKLKDRNYYISTHKELQASEPKIEFPYNYNLSNDTTDFDINSFADGNNNSKLYEIVICNKYPCNARIKPYNLTVFHNGHHSNCLLKAIENGFDLDSINLFGETIFHKGHHSEILDYAINKGFNVNSVDINGNTIFHNGYHQKSLRYAIQKGFNCNIRNNKDETVFNGGHDKVALDYAIEKGFNKKMKLKCIDKNIISTPKIKTDFIVLKK